MKTLKTMILSVGAVALLGASGLYAQTRATAAIPFAFTVQNTTLPAGDYTVSQASALGNLMLIRNLEAHKAMLVIAPGGERAYRSSGDKNVLVFHKVGGRYFLAEVKTDAICGSIVPSKLERELASEGGGQTMASLILPAQMVR